jgi:hypothetical protein
MTQEEVMQIMTDMGLHEGGMDNWVADNAWWKFAKLVAQHEREKFCAVLRQLHDSYSLASDSNAIKAALEAKDEPVACSVCSEWEKVCDQHLRYINKLKKKRIWVGLKDEDEIDWDGGDLKSLIKAIEKALKERNT